MSQEGMRQRQQEQDGSKFLQLVALLLPLFDEVLLDSVDCGALHITLPWPRVLGDGTFVDRAAIARAMDVEVKDDFVSSPHSFSLFLQRLQYSSPHLQVYAHLKP